MPPEGGAKIPIRPATARVFFALWPSEALATALAEIANQAAQRYGGRITRTDTIHLTLAFLGEVPELALPKLCELAASLEASPFELAIDRLRFWPHNQLLWAGCSACPPALASLVKHLQQHLIAAGFMPDRADRHCTPHVTLLRKVPLTTAPSKEECLPNITPLPWPCSRWVLVRSHLTAGGSNYQVVAEFSLR